MGRRAKRQSMWPATAACALAGAAVVATLLVPLDPAVRTWTVRALLVALVLGVGAWVVVRGRVRPTRADRPERIAFQAVFFWGFFTGITFAVPALGEADPGRALLGGGIAGVLFGAGLLALDPWVVRRSAPGASPDRPRGDGSASGNGASTRDRNVFP